MWQGVYQNTRLVGVARGVSEHRRLVGVAYPEYIDQ